METAWIVVIGTLGGALIGAVIAPFFNHRYKIRQLEEEHKKKIDYMKKEKIFEERLEYFKKIGKNLDKVYIILFSLKRVKSSEEFNEKKREIEELILEITCMNENQIYFGFFKPEKIRSFLIQLLEKVNSISKNKFDKKEKMDKEIKEFGEIYTEILQYIHREIQV